MRSGQARGSHFGCNAEPQPSITMRSLTAGANYRRATCGSSRRCRRSRPSCVAGDWSDNGLGRGTPSRLPPRDGMSAKCILIKARASRGAFECKSRPRSTQASEYWGINPRNTNFVWCSVRGAVLNHGARPASQDKLDGNLESSCT